MDASLISERAIEHLGGSAGALLNESVAFNESGDNEQHWERQDGETALTGDAAWQNYQEAAEVEAQSLALDVIDAGQSAAEEAQDQQQEVLDEVVDSSLSSVTQNMACEEEDQDEMVDSSLSAAIQNMASEEQDEVVDGSLSAAMQTMASEEEEDQDEVVQSCLSAMVQNMASEEYQDEVDSSLSAATQNMASEDCQTALTGDAAWQNHQEEAEVEAQSLALDVTEAVQSAAEEAEDHQQEREVLNEPLERMDVEASSVFPQKHVPAREDADADVEEDASHEQDADKSQDGARACKRRRIGEQGQAVNGASGPRPMLCRLRSQVFPEDGIARSGLASEQEGHIQLQGPSGSSQRLVAPFKRFFSWLQSSWASRVGPPAGSAAESQQSSESQVDSVAKPMESQRRQSVSGHAAAFGA